MKEQHQTTGTAKKTEKTDKTDGAPHNGIPKGIGVSPKVFFIFAAIIVTLFVVVLVMIFSYRGHHAQNTKVAPTSFSDQSMTAQSAINKLDGKSDGSLVGREKAGPIAIKHQGGDNKIITNQAPDLAAQDLRQAAKSNISVVNNYHGPSQQVSQLGANNPYQEQANALTQEGKSLSEAAQNALDNLQPGGNYNGQNMQKEKTAFLKQSKANNKFYLSSKVTHPRSPYEVKAGTIIPALLITGINSDLPGQISAQVSSNVYDTVTGNYLLIPQGARVIGAYDSKVAYGQSRVLIAWQRLIFPNGDSFDLEGQPGVDLAGMAGLHDLTNNHYFRIFGSALMFSMFGALGQLSQPQQTSTNALTNQQIIYGAIGQQLSQTGAQLVEKNINIQPTLTIRPGAAFNILLTRDMVLPGPYKGV